MATNQKKFNGKAQARPKDAITNLHHLVTILNRDAKISKPKTFKDGSLFEITVKNPHTFQMPLTP